MLLGVNIDHVATVRNARGELEPNVLEAAKICVEAGARGITAHLREDRRHICDYDVFAIKNDLKCRLNLEMAATYEMKKIASGAMHLNSILQMLNDERHDLSEEDKEAIFEAVESAEDILNGSMETLEIALKI